MHPLGRRRRSPTAKLHQGIKGLDPISTGQLSRDEIERAEKNPTHKLKLSEPKVRVPDRSAADRYTPVSSARIARTPSCGWFIIIELKDAQISRLVGTTKSTIEQIRDRTHWNAANLTPMDPVTLGLCGQIDLDMEVEKAAKGRPLPTAAELGETLQSAHETGSASPRAKARGRKEIDADAVFAKLKSLILDAG